MYSQAMLPPIHDRTNTLIFILELLLFTMDSLALKVSRRLLMRTTMYTFFDQTKMQRGACDDAPDVAARGYPFFPKGDNKNVPFSCS